MNPEATGNFTPAACYIRVSTDRQEELSPAAQQRLLLDYACSNHMRVSPEHIFIENGISGRKAEKRPQFQRMVGMAKTEQPPFRVILVWKFSRFARNQEESIVYKSMLKKQHGIDVVSITEPLAEGPFGSLIERIIEWMDEYYSINLSGEVLRGMTEKALRGGCQSAPCLGYRAPGGGQPFEIVPEEAEIVQYIFFQFAIVRLSAAAIARSLNERGITTRRGRKFETRSVVYILRNRFYIGKVSWNGIERDGAQERFLSEELFSLAKERLDAEYAPRQSRRPSSRRHWLSGMVKCAACGASLGYNKSAYPFFQCWKYAKGMHPGSCSIQERQLTEAIFSFFRELLAGADFLLSPADTPLPASRVSAASCQRSPDGLASPDASLCQNGLENAILPGPVSCRFTSESAAIPGAPLCLLHPEDISHADVTLCQSSLKKLALRELRIKEAYEAGIDTLPEYQENKQRLQSERARLNALLASARKQETAKKQNPQNPSSAPVYTLREFFESDAIPPEQKAAFLCRVLEEIVWDKQKNRLSFFLRTP
ncbi:recombinase family protein [Marvinbryantia formatexigens]|uniref:recombinase family protein n=1 Tax=Marvinbryantia formatexigens TaxID=168384 RepID=UPI00067FE457|nr:recombinase family protein [Marvinbryantia formatexigens]UWO25379.1 recombinase family protein [Marvinbryantia formatexigens DSM 14469]SDG72991.1 Site-specific DNA recombinase [Marvinbryantia formatexigens]